MEYIKAAVFAGIDNTLTYRTEEDVKGKKGCRIVVPLGTKLATGIITEIIKGKDLGCPASKVKPIKQIMDKEPVLSPELMKLGK